MFHSFRSRWRSLSLTILLTTLIGPSSVTRAAMDPEWVGKWTEDLRYAEKVLREEHPKPFESLSSEELESEFEQLRGRLPALDHHQVIVELARIVARLEDGHTRLTLPLAEGVEFMQGHSETEPPSLAEMQFHQYPVRLALDGEGVWVQSVARAHMQLLGGRVVAIDDHSAEEVVALVRPTIRADNEMQVLHHLPMHLVLCELLQSQRVTSSAQRAAFTVETLGGSVERVALSPVADGATVDWVRVGPDRGQALPLSHRSNSQNFWFTEVEAGNLVYLQFNAVYDTESETIRQFSERLSTVLRQSPEAALVIDLRRNRGGNQSLALPLLHAVIASPQNRAGRLFTIIGRATFSAAMNFALQMEKHTQTLFVGEPTGSKPNHQGDARKFLLPSSKVTLRISTLHWQWDPRDSRSWIEPHLEAPPSRDGELAGIDPAMQVIDSLMAGGDPADQIEGTWQGNLVPASYGRDSVLHLTSSNGSLRASIDIPPIGVKGAVGSKLVVAVGEVSFDLTVGEETIQYRGRIRGPWIIGRGDLGSVRFPFALARPCGSPNAETGCGGAPSDLLRGSSP